MFLDCLVVRLQRHANWLRRSRVQDHGETSLGVVSTSVFAVARGMPILKIPFTLLTQSSHTGARDSSGSDCSSLSSCATGGAHIELLTPCDLKGIGCYQDAPPSAGGSALPHPAISQPPASPKSACGLPGGYMPKLDGYMPKTDGYMPRMDRYMPKIDFLFLR